MPIPFAPPSSRVSARGWWGNVLVGLVAMAVSVFYFWTASSNTDRFRFKGPSEDYYNRLSHGFLDGHTAMNVAPLVGKAKEADTLGLGHMPFLLDASFYRGKYYLYFGPTPVLTAFLPYRLLTGSDLSDNFVAALFACAGYLVSLQLVLRVRRKYFPGAGGGMDVAFALLLGPGNACAVMLRRPMFYETAIACAYFFGAVALLGIYRALAARTCGARVGWLAVGSAALGLAVGARANYAVGSVAVLVASGWLWRRRALSAAGEFRGLVFAALGPLAVAAVGLMAYNYERFGSVFEFGVSYQFTYRPVFSLRFLLHNLKLYYGSLPELSWFFPFSFPIDEGTRPEGYVGFEQLHGQAWSVLLLPWVIAGGAVLWKRRAAAGLSTVRAFFFCAAALYVANLGVLLCLGGRANRYMVDFQPALLLLAALGAMAWHREISNSSVGRRLASSAFVAIALLGGLHNVCSSLQLYDLFKDANPRAYEKISVMMNAPTQWAGPWLYPQLGPVRMQVEFPSGRVGGREPLLCTGSAEHGDCLLVQYEAGDTVRFVLFHYGYAEIVSAPVALAPGHSCEMEIDLGSLYPPAAHAFFEPFSTGERTLIKRNVVVRLDGRTVFAAQHDLYDASPSRVYLGENPVMPTYSRPRFSGKISAVRRLGLAPLLDKKRRESEGAVVFRLMFPSEMAGRGPEPLLVTGERGRGDAIFVEYEDSGHVRFGCDRWGAGQTLSGPVAVDVSVPHTVEIWMGSLFPSGPSLPADGLAFYRAAQLKELARVRFDGRDVFRSPGVFHPASSSTVDPGHNAIGLSSCAENFSGTIEEASRLPLPTFDAALLPAIGPVRMRVSFPRGLTGRNEPLVATGKPGSRDVVYVSYPDDRHVAFGFGHRGLPPVVSAPVAIADVPEHDVEIDFGALYPPENLSSLSLRSLVQVDRLRRSLRIRLDGREVFSTLADFYPSTLDEIEIGADRTRSVSNATAFSGEILRVVRPGFGEPRKIISPTDFGGVALDVAFPKKHLGQTEPLLVTGHGGAGDALLVRYVDDAHVVLSWDHWGSGGPSSVPLAIDYDEVHRIEVEMGSLYPVESAALGRALPAAEIARRRTRLEVKIDGRVVFSAEGPFHPATTAEFYPGSNPIGLSSAGPNFSGRIEVLRRWENASVKP